MKHCHRLGGPVCKGAVRAVSYTVCGSSDVTTVAERGGGAREGERSGLTQSDYSVYSAGLQKGREHDLKVPMSRVGGRGKHGTKTHGGGGGGPDHEQWRVPMIVTSSQ